MNFIDKFQIIDSYIFFVNAKKSSTNFQDKNQK